MPNVKFTSLACLIGLFIFVAIYQWSDDPTQGPKVFPLKFRNQEIENGYRNAATVNLTSTTQDKDREIRILFWKPIFGKYVEFNIDRKQCGNCVVSYDTKYLESSDAVIIHYSEARVGALPNPAKRHPNQMYVFFSMESPYAVSVLRGMHFNSLGPYFNWTMNYRRDADIFFPCFEWYVGHNVFNGDTKDQYSPKVVQDIISKKVSPPLVLWMAGNCGSTHGAKLRMQLVREIEAAGLIVDKRGGCFGTQAPRGDDYKTFAAKYKFYFSFENAMHCRDYITEKLWRNALDSGLVPIVWGPKREDLEQLAPKGSYIFYEDFQSSAKLVEYLNYLDTNDTAYAEYFNWRLEQPSPSVYKMVDHASEYKRRSGICQMCQMLTEKVRFNNVSKIIKSLDSWWTGTEREECLSNTIPLHPTG
ncbi:4-galactosyl-N-acetylglucosaminide 3-alpha-L-fucosyltransferase FUT6 [Ciona intestinalis]